MVMVVFKIHSIGLWTGRTQVVQCLYKISTCKVVLSAVHVYQKFYFTLLWFLVWLNSNLKISKNVEPNVAPVHPQLIWVRFFSFNLCVM